jgi:hypothetical protein
MKSIDTPPTRHDERKAAYLSAFNQPVRNDGTLQLAGRSRTEAEETGSRSEM